MALAMTHNPCDILTGPCSVAGTTTLVTFKFGVTGLPVIDGTPYLDGHPYNPSATETGPPIPATTLVTIGGTVTGLPVIDGTPYLNGSPFEPFPDATSLETSPTSRAKVVSSTQSPVQTTGVSSIVSSFVSNTSKTMAGTGSISTSPLTTSSAVLTGSTASPIQSIGSASNQTVVPTGQATVERVGLRPILATAVLTLSLAFGAAIW